MKQFYKFDTSCFESMIGKYISGIHFVEDFRYPNGSTSEYIPYFNRFEGIQNLIFWYYRNEDHNSLKLYSVDNGRIAAIDEEGNEKLTNYGLRSIAFKENKDLRFGKNGSIRLKSPNGFSISGSNELVQKISFFQEIREDIFEEFKSHDIVPQFRTENLFPDRILIEGDSMYFIIRAEEDYDQNMLLKLKVGYKNDDDKYFKSGYKEETDFRFILIKEIS